MQLLQLVLRCGDGLVIAKRRLALVELDCFRSGRNALLNGVRSRVGCLAALLSDQEGKARPLRF
jgi:hypothetical protein